MKIDLLFVSCNRLDYTKLALPSLLADPTEEFSLTIWDNASTDGTKEYLTSVEDPRIMRKVFSRENVRVSIVVNECFSKSSADLVGFIPNDFLVTPGWTRPLAQAHAEVHEFGMIACWHLGPGFFDEEQARHKIQKFGQHQVLRHPYTDGGAGLIKLKTLRECGPLACGLCGKDLIQVAVRGYVNGFYFPLIYVEHMDYPWSEHYAFSDRLQEGIEMSVSYRSRGIQTLEDAKAWHQVVIHHILDEPWDVKYYVGWRDKLRRARKKFGGIFRLHG
jgi:glycosyltransferase involved in cell wall biosynthesis